MSDFGARGKCSSVGPKVSLDLRFPSIISTGVDGASGLSVHSISGTDETPESLEGSCTRFFVFIFNEEWERRFQIQVHSLFFNVNCQQLSLDPVILRVYELLK